MYLIEKTINKIYSTGESFFLNPRDLKEVSHHLKKNTYSIYQPNPYSEKNIIYLNSIPKIILLEIKSPINLRHQDILGTLFSLGIEDHLFGDIVIYNNHYYFYTFDNMRFFFENELTKIRNANVELIEQPLEILNDYQPNFQELTIINSSLRIDSVIAKVIQTNRDTVKDLIKDKKIILNYEILTQNEKKLNIGDIFSIRKYGKYRLKEIVGNTKKENLIIQIQKYIDE